jgi:hypothetical protein
MASIVTLIDDPFRDALENIWGELKAVFGLKQLCGSTAPCFTWHAADRYDDAALDAALARVAADAAPLSAETGQLALLRGAECLLYIPVLADDALLALHAHLWSAAGAVAEGVREAYAAATWAPHISIAIGRLSESEVEDILPLLNTRDTAGRIPVTNLTAIPDARSTPESWRTVPLGRP